MSLMGCRSRPRVRKFSKRFCGSLRARIRNRKIWATANLNSCRGKSERSCNSVTSRTRGCIAGGETSDAFQSPAILGLVLISLAANAAHFPAPKEGYWIARDFHFHTGEVLPEVRLHYRTIGKPEGVPIVVLHGTGSSGQSMTHSPENCSEPGQPLDAEKYFIILPDAIGQGNSTKPSDGL